MDELDASAVAERLDEIGARLELSGENPFKTRAYRAAAECLRALAEPLSALASRERLLKLPGVGEALAEKILTLRRTGTHPTLERLRRDVPDGLLELTRVAGLGPKRVLQLREQLGVSDLNALEAALASGRIAEVKGFGPKVRAGLSESIAFVRASREQKLLPEAERLLAHACETALKHTGVRAAVPAGPVRRACETVSELVVALSADRPWAVPPLDAGVAVRAARPERFGVALLYATGSGEHLAALEAHAAGRGLHLTPEGLLRGDQALDTPAEEDVYAALGLPFIPPELREGRGEVASAAAGVLPRLLRQEDIRGLLHVHTTASDGLGTLEQMAAAARELGMQYLGLADHSRSAGYAGGLGDDAVRRQWDAIEKVNERAAAEAADFRVLRGIESDIRADGSLDYSDDVLAGFDFVVASVHSQFNLPRAEQTTRVCRAVAHPATTVLGHPTGRLLLQRPVLDLDLEAVLAACAQHGVAVELNAQPMRLDLDWRWHARARELGVKLSIAPDAHSTAELAFFTYGVRCARKGGVPAEQVVNTLSRKDFEAWLGERKKCARPATQGG